MRDVKTFPHCNTCLFNISLFSLVIEKHKIKTEKKEGGMKGILLLNYFYILKKTSKDV